MEGFELIKMKMKGIRCDLGVQFHQKLMKIQSNLKVTIQLIVRVSIYEFSILGLKTCFDDENMKFRPFKIIIDIHFAKTM